MQRIFRVAIRSARAMANMRVSIAMVISFDYLCLCVRTGTCKRAIIFSALWAGEEECNSPGSNED